MRAALLFGVESAHRKGMDVVEYMP